jgi:hypothetical protein|tara:strand:- start:96 stop:356 length:261 start_codon:yes stop_codon:yes gene_type:complete
MMTRNETTNPATSATSLEVIMTIAPSLSPLLDSPLAFFAECDRLAAIPLASDERARWAYLQGKAQSCGLQGSERMEFIQLDKRRNS